MTDQHGSDEPAADGGRQGGSSEPGSGYPPYPPQGGPYQPYPGQQPTGQYPGQQYPGQPQGGQYPGQPQGGEYPGGYSGQPGPSYPPPYGSGPGGQPPGGYPGQGGYYGTPSYPGGGGYDQVNRGWNVLAIVAFVLSLLCGGLVVIPIVLAIIALVQISNRGGRGKGLAIASLVITVAWVAGFIGLGVWLATSTADRNQAGDIVDAGRLPYSDIRVGDCLQIDGLSRTSPDIDVFDLLGVPCADEHNAVAVKVIRLQAGAYPGQAQLLQQNSGACRVAAQNYASPTTNLSSYLPFTLVPTDSLWDDSENQQAVCFLVRSDFGPITESFG